MSTQAFVKVEKITKEYGNLVVLRNISFEVEKGEVLVLCGPSGCGKSTLLRCINGLEKFREGQIWVNGMPVQGATHKELMKVRLMCGMVFQSFNLFPHMTALENIIEAPINASGISKKEAVKTAMVLLNKLGLEKRANAYPCELSGGEKQRVAIARACALNPSIICFDEPTSALDPELTEEISKIIKELSNSNIGIIIVTHDMDFVKSVAQRVILMEDGTIIKDETKKDFFTKLENNILKNLA